MASAPPSKGSATFLSTWKPLSASFVSFLCDHPPRQHGGVFPSLARSAGGDRWRRRLKAQEPDQVLRSRKPLFSDENLFDPKAPTSYIDVLKTFRPRHPSSRQQKVMREGKVMCEGDEKCAKALQQCAREFVDGIIKFVSSEKEHYKLIIIACKENTNMIKELGFISCYNRDDILSGLESIEDDIAKGIFEWRENKDVRSDIVEALVKRVGEPARKLDAPLIQYVQKLTILRLWFHDSADTIVNQIEQLQVELVLLALRNWGFVVRLLFRRTDWILLGELILSKVEMLEKDVSRLRSCKNEIDSKLLITFPLCSTDGYLDRLSNDVPHLLQNAVVNFGNMVIGDIAIDICSLKREISYWTTFRFLTPNDGVMESFSLLEKHVSDLSKLTTIQRDSLTSCYGLQEQDTCQRFLSVYVIVQQLLKATTDFAKHASFDHKKVQSSPSTGYIKTGSSEINTVKISDKDQSAKATQEFISRSDEVMKRLVDWLAKHQTTENPLKFSQLEFDVC